MKRFILAFSMFSVWLAIASTYYICVIKGQCAGEEIVETMPKTTPKPTIPEKVIKDSSSSVASAEKNTDSIPTLENEIISNDTLKVSGLKIYDQQNLLKAYYGNFKIYKNKSTVKIPLGISEYGYVIAKHMDSVNSELTIKGFYNQEETPEYGLQRATSIKERLTKLGIPSKLITTTSKKRIFEYTYNKFVGGIEFNFQKSDSVINLNSVDYSLFKNTQHKVLDENLAKEITSTYKEPQITDVDMEAITKNASKVNTAAEAKKPIITETSKKDNISFTVTEKDFRNEKFKPSRNFKKFLETYKASNKIQLTGYSNTNESANDNYNKGLKLANLVNTYLIEKVKYSGKTTTNAVKKESAVKNDIIREGVTLIVK